MNSFKKGVIALIILVITIMVGIDLIPAEYNRHFGTVIHKSILLPVEETEKEPIYIFLLWDPKTEQIYKLKCPKEEWEEFREGDKLLVLSRDGWITDFTYLTRIQGGYPRI